MKINRLVVIGGSDAGISASLRAKELSPPTEVTLILADRYPNFSICGLPFYLSGEVSDWKTLAHRTADEIEEKGIRLFPDHRVTAIIPDRKHVLATDGEGRSKTFSYDRLVIGTGRLSLVPNLPGIDLPGVFFLRWMADSFAFQEYLTSRRPTSIVIIGAGYIGMEMADAMTRRGLSVSVVEFLPSVLTTFDPALSNVGYLYLTEDFAITRDTRSLVEAMAATRPVLATTTEAMLRAVAQGRQAIAYNVIGSYALERARRDPRIGVVFPQDYTIVTSRIAFIARDARHPAAAKLLLDFLLSRQGQSLLAQHSLWPVRTDIRARRLPAGQARPIRVGPQLLVNLDRVKRQRFLRDWNDILVAGAKSQ